MNIYPYTAEDESYLLFEVDNVYISNYQVEIINNNLDILVLPIKERQVNNKVKFDINITNKKSIKELTSNSVLSYSEYLNIITKICEIQLKCEDYLLHPQNLILNNNTIFIDNNTGEIYIVYLPIKNESLNRGMEEFKKYIVELSSLVDGRSSKEDLDTIKSINQYVYNPNITGIRLKRYLEGLQQKSKEQNLILDTKKEEPIVVKSKRKKGLMSGLREIFYKAKEKEEQMKNKEVEEVKMVEERAYLTYNATTALEKIYIDKDVFLLGRLEEAVDYVINSNAVGRVHARIQKIDNSYFLTDLVSKNGTYINGVKLVGNESYKLKNGSEIKIANVVLHFNRDVLQ